MLLKNVRRVDLFVHMHGIRIEKSGDHTYRLTASVGGASRYWSCGSRRGNSVLPPSLLLEPEFAVLRKDEFVCGAVVRNFRVMVPTEDVGRPGEWMVADPPATLRMTVDLAHARIDADADGTDEGGFTKIRAESGPEVVIGVRSTVQGPSVEREPMAQGTDEGDQERQDQDQQDQAHQPHRSVPRAIRGKCRRRYVR